MGAMHFQVDDTRIKQIKPLIPPAILMEELPLSEQGEELVAKTRTTIEQIMDKKDPRTLVVVGPCSIHDVDAAREYAQKLLVLRNRYANQLEIVMRVYFEKPRTRKGWKGLINDPYLDDSFQINKGLHLGRSLLVDLAEIGMPAGCEFLDTIMPQFFADLVSWGAIGARTTESQIHRELASGLSMPVGFKNGTDGNIQIAVDAIHAANAPHHFLSVTKQSVAAIVETSGNPYGHLILRGSSKGPNYHWEAIEAAAKELHEADLPGRIMVDCSHGNSQKDYRNQPKVIEDLANQLEKNSPWIFGIMIESNLIEGAQSHKPEVAVTNLVRGQSITDSCIGWEQTEASMERLAQASEKRMKSLMV